MADQGRRTRHPASCLDHARQALAPGGREVTRRASFPAGQGRRAMDVTDAAAGGTQQTRHETAGAPGWAVHGNWFELLHFLIVGHFYSHIGYSDVPRTHPLTI